MNINQFYWRNNTYIQGQYINEDEPTSNWITLEFIKNAMPYGVNDKRAKDIRNNLTLGSTHVTSKLNYLLRTSFSQSNLPGGYNWLYYIDSHVVLAGTVFRRYMDEYKDYFLDDIMKRCVVQGAYICTAIFAAQGSANSVGTPTGTNKNSPDVVDGYIERADKRLEDNLHELLSTLYSKYTEYYYV